MRNSYVVIRVFRNSKNGEQYIRVFHDSKETVNDIFEQTLAQNKKRNLINELKLEF